MCYTCLRDPVIKYTGATDNIRAVPYSWEVRLSTSTFIRKYLKVRFLLRYHTSVSIGGVGDPNLCG